jgi:DnaJ-class molecular chaperone
MNDNVVRLETKCPECDGKGNVEYFDSGYCANMVTMCKRCNGTGKRQPKHRGPVRNLGGR